MYHVTVDQMRLIEWARSWNWAVRFPEYQSGIAPVPNDFYEWFPASDIMYNMGIIEKFEHAAGMGAIDIPKSTNVCQITMTVYDGSRRRGENTDVLQLHKWIKLWYNEIVNIEEGVATLSEACKQIEIIHYNSLSNRIDTAAYAVYPHGEVSFTGSSEGDNNKLELSFSIAGTIGTTHESGLSSLLTRFTTGIA